MSDENQGIDKQNCPEDEIQTYEVCLKCGEEACICLKLSPKARKRMKNSKAIKVRQVSNGKAHS